MKVLSLFIMESKLKNKTLEYSGAEVSSLTYFCSPCPHPNTSGFVYYKLAGSLKGRYAGENTAVDTKTNAEFQVQILTRPLVLAHLCTRGKYVGAFFYYEGSRTHGPVSSRENPCIGREMRNVKTNALALYSMYARHTN